MNTAISRRKFAFFTSMAGSTLLLRDRLACAEPPWPQSLLRATELNHLSLDVEHVGKSQEFYAAVFGMSEVEHGRGNDRFMHFREGFINMRPSNRVGMNHFCLSVKDYSPSSVYQMLELIDTDPFYMGGRMTHCYDEDRFNVQVQEEQHGWGRVPESDLPNTKKGVFETLRLHHLTLNVSDVAKSSQFYQEVFAATPHTPRGKQKDDHVVLEIGEKFYLELLKAEQPSMDHFCLVAANFDGQRIPPELSKLANDARLVDGRIHMTDPHGIRVLVTHPEDAMP